MTNPIASLPMYDWPEIRTTTDLLWQHLQPILPALIGQKQIELTRSEPAMNTWTNPHLVFSQTCGLPYLQHLQPIVTLLGTPAYQLGGCRGSQYSSRLIANKNDQRKALHDFQGSTFAMNGADSQSGYNAMRFSLTVINAPAPFFSDQTITGSHRQSVNAVASGVADLCAVDPLSWALVKQFDPIIASSVKVIGESPYTPGLPYICANSMIEHDQVESLQQQLANCVLELPSSVGSVLPLTGIDRLTPSDYQIIRTLEGEAINKGHTILANN